MLTLTPNRKTLGVYFIYTLKNSFMQTRINIEQTIVYLLFAAAAVITVLTAN